MITPKQRVRGGFSKVEMPVSGTRKILCTVNLGRGFNVERYMYKEAADI